MEFSKHYSHKFDYLDFTDDIAVTHSSRYAGEKNAKVDSLAAETGGGEGSLRIGFKNIKVLKKRNTTI